MENKDDFDAFYDSDWDYDGLDENKHSGDCTGGL